jgi:hypothetical protein
VEQQANGFLASELSMLSIMGSSAGSLGAQVWTDRILSTVKHSRAVVVPDSYVGTSTRVYIFISRIVLVILTIP